MPVILPFPYLVSRVWWGCGSVAGGTGNFDFGIYTLDGTQIYHTGSTASGTASSIQYVSVATPFVLPPGSYYMALVNDGTTNRAWGIGGNLGTQRAAGMYQQATALPLPATATFATYGTAFFPHCGITRTASGF